MQSEAEATKHCKGLCGQYPEYAPMRKQLFLTGSRAPSRLPSRVQSLCNTSLETFLHSATDTAHPQSTATQNGFAAKIQILEPTLMKPLSRLLADPHTEEDESEAEDQAESEPPSPCAEKGTRNLQSMYQKLYPGKDTNDFADVEQGFTDITAAINYATQATELVISQYYPVIS